MRNKNDSKKRITQTRRENKENMNLGMKRQDGIEQKRKEEKG